MTTIYTDNTYAHISGKGTSLARTLLSYRKKGAHFSLAFKRGYWDGIIHLMRNDGKFPAGLVPWLVLQLTQQDIHPEIVRDLPPLGPEHTWATNPDAPVLRDYQAAAVEAAIEAERGLIEHATGAGKTVLEGEIARRLQRPTLVLVHRTDLLRQIHKRLREHIPIDIGMVGGGSDVGETPIVVATFQAIYHRLKEYPRTTIPWLAGFEVVIVDEAHHTGAKTYSAVLSQLTSARYRFGFSATPFKSLSEEDMFGVMAWLGPVIHTKSAAELVEEGYLVGADVFLIELPTPTGQAKDSYLADYRAYLTDNEARTNALCRLANRLRESDSGPTLVLVERLAHGEEMARRLQCSFVDGKEPGYAREAHWKRIREGRQHLTIASRIADEGLDLPNLQYLILAGGGKAGHTTIQKVGRGMRTAPGKDRLYVFDFIDQSPRRYITKISATGKPYRKKVGGYLSTHSAARIETYKAHQAYTITRTTIEEILD